MFSLFDPRSMSAWVGRKTSTLGDNELRSIRRTITAMSAAAGFTLIELLVVIVILGTLGSVVVAGAGKFSGAGLTAACRADVRTVSGAQELYRTRNDGYAASIDALMEADTLRTAPTNDGYSITTDDSGDVTATPGCDTLEAADSDTALPTTAPLSPTTSTTEPATTQAQTCVAAVSMVDDAQGTYHAAKGKYASNVAALVSAGYLSNNPSTTGYTIKTSNKGIVTSTPTCANISDVACQAALTDVVSAQQARLDATGKYAGNVAQLVTGGYLTADPSTDAYKIKTTNKGATTSTPDCATLA